jgi:FkbM family methyltransferase
MANILKLLLKRVFFSKSGNLISSEEPYRVIKKLLRHHDITGIIDSGASNGRVSRRFLRLFPNASVFGFEPNPSYAQKLTELAKENMHFKPQFFALLDREGMVELNITLSPGNTSIFKPGKNLKEMYPQDTDIETIEKVEAVTIDKWMERTNTPPIQLLKFDIQGGELKALEGAKKVLQKSILMIYTEILLNPLYERGAIYSEIDIFLRKFGFVLYDIFKPKYHYNGKLLWANAIFVHAERLNL